LAGIPQPFSSPSTTSTSEALLGVGDFDTDAGECKIDYEPEPPPEDKLDYDGTESNIVQ
jgi:hypothetical protein